MEEDNWRDNTKWDTISLISSKSSLGFMLPLYLIIPDFFNNKTYRERKREESTNSLALWKKNCHWKQFFPLFVYWWRWSSNSTCRYRRDNLLVSYVVEKSLLMIIVVLSFFFFFPKSWRQLTILFQQCTLLFFIPVPCHPTCKFFHPPESERDLLCFIIRHKTYLCSCVCSSVSTWQSWPHLLKMYRQKIY